MSCAGGSALDAACGHALDDVALQEEVKNQDRQHGQQRCHNKADVRGVGSVESLRRDGDGAQALLGQYQAGEQVVVPVCHANKTGLTIGQNTFVSDVIGELLDHLSGDDDAGPDPDEIEEMFAVLMQMSDRELRQMPQELVNMLYSLAEAGELPAPLEQKIRNLFRKKQK